MKPVILQLVARVAVLFAFAVPVAMFIRSAGTYGDSVGTASRAPSTPVQPLIALATRSNAGWALNGHKPTTDEMKMLLLTGALPAPPAPVSPLPPSLMVMPTTGWALDSGATITTDSKHVLVLRPLTNGRSSFPGQGQGWQAAYWYPHRTDHWHNYVVGVTVTNLGAQGSGANATIVVGYSESLGGFAVTISAARIAIQNRSRAYIYSGVIPAATAHRVKITLTDKLTVMIDGATVATFPVGHVRGGIGFGVWKASANSSLPFFTNLRVSSSS
jgi:hypothetical protein